MSMSMRKCWNLTIFIDINYFMKYLVCGAGGFIGGHLVNDLIIASTSVANNQLQISASPESNDLISLRETYLTIGIDNTVISVVEDTISSGSNLSGTGVVPESSYK